MSCLRRDLLVNFLVLPPSVNSSRMFVGAGSAPMLQAASAWDGIASELSSAASSFSSVISGLTDQAWRGPASAAMIATAAPYAAYLSSAADQAVTAAAQAKSMASLFESALVSTVHPAAVAANRGDLVSLVTSNLLGQNGPAIAATDAAYEQMWATDVAAMVDYHAGASAALEQLTPWSLLQDVLGTLEKIPGIDVVGVGNKALLTLGIGNSLAWNVGSGNLGELNLGSGNIGDLNLGSGNFGGLAFGLGNSGRV